MVSSMCYYNVVFMLFAVTTFFNYASAARTTVDPSKYKCTKQSPIDDDAWTAAGSSKDPTPAIAMTHIFCGQINSKGKAEGFHGRDKGVNPPSAETSEPVYGYPIDCFKKESVFDYKQNKFIARDIGPDMNFCFFPADWSVATTVNHIKAVFADCKNKITGGSQICARGKKYDTIIYLSAATTPAKYEVVSAFAAPSKKYQKGCSVNCSIQDKKAEL